jgi:dihydroorotase
VGADADFNLIDVHVESVIDARRFHSRHPISPYDGWKTTGAVRASYLRGSLIAENGRAIGDPTGSFVTSSRHRRNVTVAVSEG